MALEVDRENRNRSTAIEFPTETRQLGPPRVLLQSLLPSSTRRDRTRLHQLEKPRRNREAVFTLGPQQRLPQAHALDLFPKRSRNVRAALERIIERADDVSVNASSVVQAVAVYARINSDGKLVDRSERVDLNELFHRMSREELDSYAKEGKLPEWFTATVGATTSDSQDGDQDG